MYIADAAQVKEVQDRMIHTPKRQSASKGNDTGKGMLQKASDAVSYEEEGATVAISAQGMGLAQKNEEEEQTAMREEMEWKMYQEMLERANEAAEAQEEGFGDLAKALEIARRILNGDIVPPQDEKFLMEFNSEIYMRVKSMAKVKEDPKEYDTLMEEEEEEDTRSGKSGESGIRSENTDTKTQDGGAESASEEM